MRSTALTVAALVVTASTTIATPSRFSYQAYLEGNDPSLDAEVIPSDPRAPAQDGAVGYTTSPTWLEEMASPVRNTASLGEKPPKQPFPAPWAEGGFYGIKTFAHLPPTRCMEDQNATFDIAILGAPFDTSTSYRPGARFGPGGIRNGAQRLGGVNRLLNISPFEKLKMVDCGDSRMTFYSNEAALQTLESDYADLLTRKVKTPLQDGQKSLTLSGKEIPRVVMLGGDHTIVLPALRALSPYYGPISIVHFDAHCDTRNPRGDPLTHGDYFYFGHKEGHMTNTSIHGGIRVTCDEKADADAGFITIVADDIIDIGTQGVIDRILDRVGDGPVYLTIDIDTLDPAFAPATGTPEIGGWSTREMKRILHGLKGLKIVGADVVEVAPAYDDQAEITQIAAANLVFELVSMMAMTPAIV